MAQQHKSQSTPNPSGAGENPTIDPGVGVGDAGCGGCGADTDWTVYPAQNMAPAGSTTTGQMNLTGSGSKGKRPAVGEKAGLGAPSTTGQQASKDLGATLPLDKSVEE